MIDLITVVFREELPALKLQAQSIALYCQRINVGKICVVVNDDVAVVNEIQPEWWGQFRDQVTVIPRTTWPCKFVNNGWVSQQVLKLLSTEFCISAWSMILDAKTIFVKAVDPIAAKPQVGVLDIFPVFEPSRQIVNQLFDIDLAKQLGPGGVPFIINNPVAQQLVKEVTVLTGKSFADWFQEQGMVTEFILYSGYVIYKFGSFDALYKVAHSAIVPCNICHNEVDQFDHKLKLMHQSTTVSIHRRAWAQLTHNQQQQYIDFLHSRGLA